MTKTIELGGSRRDPTLSVEVTVEGRGDTPVDVRLGLEWATMMLGGGGNPSASWAVGAQMTAHDAAGTATNVAQIEQANSYIGIDVVASPSPPADAWWAPIETVSNSEAGFERVYQGSALLLSWPLRLEPGSRTVVRVEHAVSVTRDRADGTGDAGDASR